MKRAILVILAGMMAGAAGGWLYWKYYGCRESCLITSKPVNSSLYGAIAGGLLFYAVLSDSSKKINRKE